MINIQWTKFKQKSMFSFISGELPDNTMFALDSGFQMDKSRTDRISPQA